jgi:hypothetical protein
MQSILNAGKLIGGGAVVAGFLKDFCIYDGKLNLL